MDMKMKELKHTAAHLSDRIRHARKRAQMTQAALARKVGIGPSAVAQWELLKGTSPAVENLIKIAIVCEVSFEWLATGRRLADNGDYETQTIDQTSFAADHIEERLLVAFRNIKSRKRESFVRWMEEFF